MKSLKPKFFLFVAGLVSMICSAATYDTVEADDYGKADTSPANEYWDVSQRPVTKVAQAIETPVAAFVDGGWTESALSFDVFDSRYFFEAESSGTGFSGMAPGFLLMLW